jgi:hypothetical protein
MSVSDFSSSCLLDFGLSQLAFGHFDRLRAAFGTGFGNFGFAATTLGSADQSSISCPRSLTTEFLNELG